MAYPYPYPNGQPYQYQDQLSQLRNAQMQYPMQPPQMQQPRQDNGLNWVQGESGAKSWFVAPGATVLLMDSEAMRFYLKSADANGIPSLRTFEYTEIGTQRPQVPTAPAAEFVTLETFEGFRREITDRLDTLTAEPAEQKRKKGAAENE